MPLSPIGFKINARWPKVNEVHPHTLIIHASLLRFSSYVQVSVHDESMPMNNSNHHLSSTNDYENLHNDADAPLHQRKSAAPLIDVDCYDTPTSLLDPQLAAYRAIMSRMVPFANHVNGHNSPQRHIKQEPLNDPDDSSQGDGSDSSSPLHDHLSP